MLKIESGLVFYALLACAFSHQCPPENSTRPCQCTDEDGLALQCWNITNKTVLETISRRTITIHFDKIHLFESSIPFPTSFLFHKHIKSMDLVESNFTSRFLEASFPLTMTIPVEAIHLYSVRFTDNISWRQFLVMKQLKTLLAYKVDIRTLEYPFDLYVSKCLERLHFWKTATNRIGDVVFAEFEHLVDVRIQECQISELKRSYFPRPSKLQILFLDGNRIKNLPGDIFEDMPDLRSVDLSKNQLSSVSETVFGSVYKHLGDLSLSENPIQCDCDIKWIIPLQGHRYLDGYCTEPSSLKERCLVTLREADFQFCENVAINNTSVNNGPHS